MQVPVQVVVTCWPFMRAVHVNGRQQVGRGRPVQRFDRAQAAAEQPEPVLAAVLLGLPCQVSPAPLSPIDTSSQTLTHGCMVFPPD